MTAIPCPFCGSTEVTHDEDEGTVCAGCYAPRREGFWLNTEHGVAHIQGDPEMSQETLDALIEMIRAAKMQEENRGNAD